MAQEFRDKHIAIIASGGRTGTTFFGNLLSGIIEDSYSVHEPDLFAGFNARTWNQIRTFGVYHMLIGRVIGRTGIRNLNQRYLAGKLSEEQLALSIRQHREKYYGSIDKSYIIESYFQWYGILPALPKVFSHYKVVGLIRDPRTWVQSLVNQEGLYGGKKPLLKFGHKILDPFMIDDRVYMARWPHMSVFEKSCWLWAAITKTLQLYGAQDENIRIFRYEDLFLAPERDQNMEDMLRFMTKFEDRVFKYHFDPLMLENVRNSSRSAKMPLWKDWPQKLCLQMNEICGSLMRDCGYGMEKEWQDNILTKKEA
jgi:hypothetical protein